MKLWKVGKVKKVFEVSPTELEFEFTDKISVFDKIIPSLIPRKGETLCCTSAYWFQRAHAMGIKTHFKKMEAPNKMRVSRVRILESPSQSDTNYLIPLEFIVRYYVAGSLLDRIKAGNIAPASLGLSRVEYGIPLSDPFIEVTTKLEKVDRPLKKQEALQLAGLTSHEYDEIVETILKIDRDINDQVVRRGLIHVDGKKEIALDSERDIMVVDTYGTADEDRFWDRRSYEEGRCVELSKEVVRQYYRGTGYHKALYDARARGVPEPDIPPLPPDMVGKTSQLYQELYTKITGETLHESRSQS
ncbi:MAG: phosphoribosylaminoimidazolesuccinocarboxamide synthase [Theionarchaea archaeon]|nr:phosphoribosylaminoimidazolesuccinocarboxamide synthase [Theionarchaea archaeon]MBU7001652.1 phosphoribosylaminoimidazolesuccinocarboxamide synthase [Theionarchaea archaeon]MBU7021000.1 phosphoribosylaminoimidazolesuccinocarboxamide synthase [Theionarchaea archaeon]MBU7034361.1 phosphoribosylaminoimidazolesuccinocarboxamide synthase [Theionarchaea archaeon]MBU7041580.1 phosphoribosylaminoimidazolesuccinocarboxamide synthase [Theionarchaea archaeon]